MPINKQRIAAILAEKAKQQNLPTQMNPLAKPANMNLVNPLNVPMPTSPVVPMASKLPTPGFKSAGRFSNLRKKLIK